MAQPFDIQSFAQFIFAIATAVGAVPVTAHFIAKEKYKSTVPESVTVTLEDHERRISKQETKSTAIYDKIDRIFDELKPIPLLIANLEHMNLLLSEGNERRKDFERALTYRIEEVEKIKDMIVDRNLTG